MPTRRALAAILGFAVKYLMAILSTAVLLAAIAFVGRGYLNTRRAERQADDRRAAVHAMSQQQLAAAIERCDAGGEARSRIEREAAFCEDVARELDDRPLEIVPHGGPVGPAERAERR